MCVLCDFQEHFPMEMTQDLRMQVPTTADWGIVDWEACVVTCVA